MELEKDLQKLQKKEYIIMEYFIIWILFGIVAGAIGSSKGMGCSSFLIGFLLGPFGLLIVIFSKGNKISCPYCMEAINPNAIICPHCRSELLSPETTETNNKIECPSCKELILSEYNYCTNCGTKIKET